MPLHTKVEMLIVCDFCGAKSKVYKKEGISGKRQTNLAVREAQEDGWKAIGRDDSVETKFACPECVMRNKP